MMMMMMMMMMIIPPPLHPATTSVLTVLTSHTFIAEHGVVGVRVGAVPAHVADLVLTLGQPQPGALPDGHDGVRTAPADGSLARRQAGNLVADDVGS